MDTTKNDTGPAKSAKCTYCSTVGHFAKFGMGRNLQQLHEVERLNTQIKITSTRKTILTQALSVQSQILRTQITWFCYRQTEWQKQTAADTCIYKTDDLQSLPFTPRINPSPAVLKGDGGTSIDNVGASFLKVTHKGESFNSKFDVVHTPPGSPSIFGCRITQELQLIPVNIDQVTGSQTEKQESYTPPHAPQREGISGMQRVFRQN